MTDRLARTRCRRGFTLVELLAVFVILALLATAASVRLSGIDHQAKWQVALDRVQWLDHQLRVRAQTSGKPHRLEVAIGRDQLVGYQGSEIVSCVSLPAGIHVDSVRTADGTSRSGRNELSFYGGGTSASYALHLRGPRQQQRWLLMAGVTGRGIVASDEQQVQKAFEF